MMKFRFMRTKVKTFKKKNIEVKTQRVNDRKMESRITRNEFLKDQALADSSFISQKDRNFNNLHENTQLYIPRIPSSNTNALKSLSPQARKGKSNFILNESNGCVKGNLRMNNRGGSRLQSPVDYTSKKEENKINIGTISENTK